MNEMNTPRGSIVAVSASTSIARAPADGTAVAHWTMGEARDATVAIGFDNTRRENTPWWGYLLGRAMAMGVIICAIGYGCFAVAMLGMPNRWNSDARVVIPIIAVFSGYIRRR